MITLSAVRASAARATHFSIELAALAASTIGVAVVKAAVASLIAHEFGASAFAAFAAGTAVATTIAVVAEMGLGEWVLYAFRQGGRAPSGRQMLLMVALGSLAGALTFVVFAVGGGSSAGAWVHILPPLTAVNVLYAGEAVSQALLRTQFRVGLAVGLRAYQLVATVAVLLLARELGLGLVGALWCLAGSESIVMAVFGVAAWHHSSHAAASRDVPASGGETVREFAPFALSTLAAYVYMSSDALLLTLWAPITDVGDYTAGYRLYAVGLQGASLLVGVLTPVIYGAGGLVRARILASVERVQFVVVAIAAAVMCVGAPWLIDVYVGPSFDRSKIVLAVLSVSLFVKGAGAIPAAALTATGRQSLRLRVQIVVAIVSVALNVYLIPRHGLWGALATTLVCDSLLVTAYAVLAQRGRRVRSQAVQGRHMAVATSLLVLSLAATTVAPWIVATAATGLAGAIIARWLRLSDLRRVVQGFNHVRSRRNHAEPHPMPGTQAGAPPLRGPLEG